MILGDEDSFVTVWDGKKAVVLLLSEIIGYVLVFIAYMYHELTQNIDFHESSFHIRF